MRFARLFQILALLALLLAPAGMLGSHAAMAMPQAASSGGNCSEEQHQDAGGDERVMIDCAIACTALPAFEPLIASKFQAAAAAPAVLPFLILPGIQPEAATPPPRLS